MAAPGKGTDGGGMQEEGGSAGGAQRQTSLQGAEGWLQLGWSGRHSRLMHRIDWVTLTLCCCVTANCKLEVHPVRSGHVLHLLC